VSANDAQLSELIKGNISVACKHHSLCREYCCINSGSSPWRSV